MKKIMLRPLYCLFSLSLLVVGCKSQKAMTESPFSKDEVTRIIKSLSSDDMKGRHSMKDDGGIKKAADFINKEFEKIGLEKPDNQKDFLQRFSLVKPVKQEVVLSMDGETIPQEKIYVRSYLEDIDWKQEDFTLYEINEGEDFRKKFAPLLAEMSESKKYLVKVSTAHAQMFKAFTDYFRRQGAQMPLKSSNHYVFVCTDKAFKNTSLKAKQTLEKQELFNVYGILKGKGKADETVIVSAHYDHIGILQKIDGDSIANGADDDASGVTAVISLAKHFKEKGGNERTLAFVCFTAEEVGGFGSQYYSSTINPDKAVAMFNIEMIGKESKFGKNSAFITGYEKSDFGKILNESVAGSIFKFHPDPYPQENLFYRSDNATLARLGVPAHTISTTQLDKDKYYHTVKDEFETLDVDNITSIIQAIAQGAESIISGKATPTRIEKKQ